ncbi:ammonia-forming cytochrome c nitrite reductase subunit c552 [Candidatus Desantisbacteria bacterium]|nr:ammonia-forming cytochrome c nitrite reductase subunit c552 [Candidatus Desantisbacteria bacterium]
MIDWIKEHILLTILIVIVAGAATYGGLEFSSSTFFCSTMCHIMKANESISYKDTYHWKIGEAMGGHGIGCKACHYGPGIKGFLSIKIGALLYELPHTILNKEGIEWEKFKEIMEEEKYGKDESKWPKQYIHETKDKKRKFGVKLHGKKLEDTNYNCKRCHTPIAKYINRDGLLAEEIKIQESDNLVDEHLAKNLPVKNWDDILLMKVKKINKDHAGHLDRGLSCTDCHMEVAHGYNPPYNTPIMERCFRCHDNEKAFRNECGRCHTTQKNMHKGINGIGVENAPSFMEAAGSSDCVGCHPEDNQYKLSRETCVGCHDESYRNMIDDWQNSTRALISGIKPIFAETDKMIKDAQSKGGGIDKAKKLYHEAKYNYDYVVADGSNGGHNLDYAEALLDSAKKKLESAKESLK